MFCPSKRDCSHPPLTSCNFEGYFRGACLHIDECIEVHWVPECVLYIEICLRLMGGRKERDHLC